MNILPGESEEEKNNSEFEGWIELDERNHWTEDVCP